MDTKDIFNVIAVVLSPIIAVWIGQLLQKRNQKRQDKFAVFKTLITYRWLYCAEERIKALNCVEIVFADSKEVIDRWRAYFKFLAIQQPSEDDVKKIDDAHFRFLGAMAKDLGYENFSSEYYKGSYMPKGYTDSLEQQEKFKSYQIAGMEMFVDMMKKQHG